jgi:hypothetical protein
MMIHLRQVLSQLLRKAKQRNFVLPNVKSQGAGQGEGFEGATVRLNFTFKKCWGLL